MTTSKDIDVVVSRSEQVLAGHNLPARIKTFKTYAVTNFRGGIGKSTLSFNLAYELSRSNPCLLLDTCSQKNLTQNIFGDHISDFEKTLYDALISELTNTSQVDYSDIVVNVKPYGTSFAGGKPTFMIPGSTELFLFPSLLLMLMSL